MGRPRNRKRDKSMLAIQLPREISDFLDKDSDQNFRGKGQHIISILNDYMKQTLKDQIEETKELVVNSVVKKIVNARKTHDLTNAILDDDIEARTIGTEDETASE